MALPRRRAPGAARRRPYRPGRTARCGPQPLLPALQLRALLQVGRPQATGSSVGISSLKGVGAPPHRLQRACSSGHRRLGFWHQWR
jgi:hypothetical protein